jgi:hypothetical protein
MIYTNTELAFVNKTNTNVKKEGFIAKLFNSGKKVQATGVLPRGLSVSERRDFLAISGRNEI